MAHLLRPLAIASIGLLVHVNGSAQTAPAAIPRESLEFRKDKSFLVRSIEASGRLPKFELAKVDQPSSVQLETLRSASIEKLVESGAVPRFEDLKVSIYDDKDLAKAKYELWKKSLVPDPVLLNHLRRNSIPTSFKKSSKAEFTEFFREVMKKHEYVFMINAGTPVLSPRTPSTGGGGDVSGRPSTSTSGVDDLWTGA